MKSKVILIVFTVAILMPNICSSDGKFYARHSGRVPELPHQRAVIIFNDKEEVLLLQSKFIGSVKDFGWVLPLPQITELVSMKSEESDKLFHDLIIETQPRVIFFPIGIASLIVVIVISLWIGVKGKGWGLGCFSLIVVALMLTYMTPLITREKFKHIDVIRDEKVGIYDVKVIKGKDPKAIISWLRAHNYNFNENDQDAFQQYIEKDWCFLTARIDQERIKESAILSQGMVHPILVRFNYQKPVYPLILTGTAGRSIELVLYAFASAKVITNSPLQMNFAGKIDVFVDKTIDLVDSTYKSKSKIPIAWQHCSYLTKFSGKLSPENMNEDLFLYLAPDNKAYREKEVDREGIFLLGVALFLLLLQLIHLVKVSYRNRKKRDLSQI